MCSLRELALDSGRIEGFNILELFVILLLHRYLGNQIPSLFSGPIVDTGGEGFPVTKEPDMNSYQALG